MDRKRIQKRPKCIVNKSILETLLAAKNLFYGLGIDDSF